MKTLKSRPFTARRCKERSRKILPSLETFEDRCLLSGFLQGTVFAPGNIPLSGATVDLYNSSNAQVGTVVTPSNGYYQFDNLTAGTYELFETPPGGYANNGAAVNSPINPVQSVSPGTTTEVVVRVNDISGFTAVDFNSSDFFAANGNSPKNVIFDVNQNYGNTSAASLVVENLYPAQLPVTATNSSTGTNPTTYTTPLFSTFCADVLHELDGGNNIYPVLGQEMPGALNIAATGISNAGSIAYLYNTYGNSPSSLSNPDATGGLQLAIWEMVYNPFTAPVTAAQLQAGNNLSNFQPGVSTTSADLSTMFSDAAADINQSLGQNQLAVYLAVNGAPILGGDQGVLATSVINFNTISMGTPAIATSASPTGEVVGTQFVKDTANLTGGSNPTGSITFTLTSPSNTVVDTETVAVNGDGNYTTPTGIVPTQTGTYYWVASYSGDNQNVAVASGDTDEPVVISPSSLTLSTTASVSAGGVVGVAMLDR